jgi:hypothetical protein
VDVSSPGDAGVKPTWTLQLLPLANVAPHVLAPHEKLAADGPVIWNPTFAMGAPPELLMVIKTGAPDVATARGAKSIRPGLTVIKGGFSPVPERETVWLRSASETIRDPVAIPASVGANTTLIAQLACAPRDPPQSFEA